MIAIIAVLVAILLPAVQAVRQEESRVQRLGNLRQIGIELHHYHDQARTFPPGFITHADEERAPRAVAS